MYKVREIEKAPTLQAAAGRPTTPVWSQVGRQPWVAAPLPACSRAAPGEVGRCAAAWPARRVGRRRSAGCCSSSQAGEAGPIVAHLGPAGAGRPPAGLEERGRVAPRAAALPLRRDGGGGLSWPL